MNAMNDATLISHTMPCHKREADLARALPSVLQAAAGAGPVEVLVVEYGNVPSLVLDNYWVPDDAVLTMQSVYADHFHMAHARNVGIRAANGEIVCAFVCDQVVAPNFFEAVRRMIQPGVFLSWQETYVAYREDLLDAGGFDERFEFYGPEGKELAERLRRLGLREARLPKDLVYQIPTSYRDKVRHYRLKLTRREMHHVGMSVWRENAAAGLLVANEGRPWGSLDGPEPDPSLDARIAEARWVIAEKDAKVLHA